MNFKTTYILFGALVILLAIAAVSLLTGPKKGEEDKLFPGLEAENVTRLVIERKQPVENKLVFVRTGKQTWKLEEPYAAQVNGRQVESLVSGILSARTVTKNVELSRNLERHGLDQPSMVVTLDAGGKSYTINLGTVLGTAESGIVYVNTSQNKDPAAVKRSSLSTLLKDTADAKTAGDLFKNIGEYRNRDLLIENAFNAPSVVQSVKLKNDKSEIVLKKSASGSWEFEKPTGFGEADINGDGGPANEAPSGIKPLMQALAAIRANSTEDFIENVTDFKQYGLAPKPVGPTIEMTRDGSEPGSPPITLSISVGKKDDKGERVFVRPGDENVVVTLPAGVLEPITKLLDRPSVLRSRILLPGTVMSADAIDIQLGSDAPMELRRMPDGWKMLSASGDAKNASGQTILGLLSDLTQPRAIREFPDPKLSDVDKGFDKPSAIVTIWVNGIIEEPKKDDSKGKDGKPEDKKDDKKDEKKPMTRPKLKDFTAKLIFGKRDKDLLYVRREMGGVKTDLAVSESLWPKLMRGRLDYLDAVLPSFVIDQATKLSFNRGGENWVIEKQTHGGSQPTWVIQQPSQLTGRHAETAKVVMLLRTLAVLRSTRLWADKATEKELERFGLKPPRLQATVTLADEKVKERVYQFGAETDDKANVYAKLSDSDLVFGVRKDSLDVFLQSELIDPTVFHFDLSKVNGLKLTGWKDSSVNDQPQTLDLERRSANNWSVRGNDKYKLSVSSAESLLMLLADLRAEKFVVYKTGPKPEMKLSPAEGGLQIEIGIEGEKDPITLTIGAQAEGNKSYYAMTNRSPGDVFLIPKDKFEKFKTKPSVFSAE